MLSDIALDSSHSLGLALSRVREAGPLFAGRRVNVGVACLAADVSYNFLCLIAPGVHCARGRALMVLIALVHTDDDLEPKLLTLTKGPKEFNKVRERVRLLRLLLCLVKGVVDLGIIVGWLRIS